jgi:hypothetical protein
MVDTTTLADRSTRISGHRTLTPGCWLTQPVLAGRRTELHSHVQEFVERDRMTRGSRCPTAAICRAQLSWTPCRLRPSASPTPSLARCPPPFAAMSSVRSTAASTLVNDAEYLKATQDGNYGSYLFDRVVGFSREQVDRARPPKRDISGARDRPDFPGFYESGLWCSGSGGPVRPGFPTPGPPPTEHAELACTGPLSYTAQDAIAATGGLTAEARSRGARNRPGGASRAHCTAAGEVCGRRGPGEPGSRHWLRHRLPGWSR